MHNVSAQCICTQCICALYPNSYATHLFYLQCICWYHTPHRCTAVLGSFRPHLTHEQYTTHLRSCIVRGSEASDTLRMHSETLQICPSLSLSLSLLRIYVCCVCVLCVGPRRPSDLGSFRPHHSPRPHAHRHSPPHLHSSSQRDTATHCNTLQHTATHCNTLQHTATNRISTRLPKETLQHTATHGNTLQHTATHCKTLQHTASLRSRKLPPASDPRTTHTHNRHTRKRERDRERDGRLFAMYPCSVSVRNVPVIYTYMSCICATYLNLYAMYLNLYAMYPNLYETYL